MLRKDFNKVLDTYLKTGDIKSDDYEELDISQESVIQELKKAFKRIKEPDTTCIDPETGIDCNDREGIPF